ncbi:MAG: amylo-alpha-1,6-glucosidase, partial [Alistipes sp.]|nr:amylo-alpha-1,6-glucosidase [Alistipes sp.]
FFWTLQRLEKEMGGKEIWKRYGAAMKGILENYRRGMDGRIVMNENGLIWAQMAEFPVSWMDSMIDGVAVTPRNGYQVEVQALWYNAVMYALELAKANKDKEFVAAWENVPELTKKSFNELFVLKEGYLADYVGAEGTNEFIRPNMVIACGLKYKMLSSEVILDTLRTIRQHLLTPRGLRTLSPRNPLYRGSQEGTPAERDFAGKNGSVWPWLLPFYVAAAFDINGDRYLPTAEEILEYFEEDIQSYGIGSICELYDADPPYASRGAISHAWSVSAVLDIYEMIRERKGEEKPAKKAPAKKAAPKKTAAKKATEKKK